MFLFFPSPIFCYKLFLLLELLFFVSLFLFIYLSNFFFGAFSPLFSFQFSCKISVFVHFYFRFISFLSSFWSSAHKIRMAQSKSKVKRKCVDNVKRNKATRNKRNVLIKSEYEYKRSCFSFTNLLLFFSFFHHRWC